MVNLSAQDEPQHILVESPAFKAGEALPRDYTREGRNLSPPLTWRHAPAGTKQFAVLVEDPGGSNPTPNVLWVLYGIPSEVTGIPEGVPAGATVSTPPELAGAMQGFGAYWSGDPGYRGPLPPHGTTHLYRFIVYALDAALDLKPGLDRMGLLRAIQGHVIGEGEIVATYRRETP